MGKISGLDAKTTLHDTDLVPIVDIEAAPDKTKQITGANLKKVLPRFTLNKLLKGAGVDTDPTEVVATKITLGVLDNNLFANNISGDTPFTAKINGNPTATSVPYDTDTGENSIGEADQAGYGKLVLHNLTRGNSRLIESSNRATNIITTQSSTDNWADGDDITTQSQTNTQAGYVDLDLSGFLAATANAIFLCIFFKDTGAVGEVIRLHPYEAYNIAKTVPVWNKTTSVFDTLVAPIPILSQRITLLVTASGTDTAYLVLKYFGKFEDA